MNNKKIIIFGAGARLKYVLDDLKDDVKILAIADNDSTKWGKLIDGIKIISPEEILEYDFDKIYISPVIHNQIRKQLFTLGILDSKIIDETNIEYLCSETLIAKTVFKETKSKKAVIFSHALTSTGAQNVLMTLLYQINKDYDIRVISTSDGVLRNELEKNHVSIWIMRDIHTHIDEVQALINSADLVLVNTFWLYYITLIFSKYKKNIVWWIHEALDLDCFDKAIFQKCIEHHVNIYAVSELVRDEILFTFNGDIPINIFRFGIPQYSQKLVNHNKLRFVVLATIDFIKGQDLLISAVQKISADIKRKAEFFLIGGGKKTKEFIDSAEQAGIQVVNEVSRERIADLYAEIDVVICSSRKEAMSVTIAEGWMNKKITIISDAIGIARYASDYENALIFQSENVEELKEKIEWVISNKEKAAILGEKGRILYDKYFSMKVFSESLEKILLTVENDSMENLI